MTRNNRERLLFHDKIIMLSLCTVCVSTQCHFICVCEGECPRSFEQFHPEIDARIKIRFEFGLDPNPRICDENDGQCVLKRASS